MYTCFFIGHRDAPSVLEGQLYETVLHLVMKCHVDRFIVGHYGNFDAMATAAVQRVIREHPEKEILADMLEPYFPGDRDVRAPAFFDAIYYPEGLETVPRRYCIEKANQLALEESHYLVAYVARNGGNARKLLGRARRMAKQGGMKIINLADE